MNKFIKKKLYGGKLNEDRIPKMKRIIIINGLKNFAENNEILLNNTEDVFVFVSQKNKRFVGQINVLSSKSFVFLFVICWYLLTTIFWLRK